MLVRLNVRESAPRPAFRVVWQRQGFGVSAFGNALGSSIADGMQSPSQTETQGVGPYSDLNYRNGSDIDSDNAYYERTTQEALLDARAAGPGLSDSATNAEVMAYLMRQAGGSGQMTPAADFSGNAFGIAPSDSRGFLPNDDASSADTGRRPGDPAPGTMGPRRNGPDAFTDGIAKSFAEDAAARKAAAGQDLRDWLNQENPVLGPVNEAAKDFALDVGLKSPVLGALIDGARWLTLGDGSNADPLLAAVGPLGKVEGRLGLAAEERLAVAGGERLGEKASLRLTSSELGELLGRGGNKDVFAFGEGQAVGVLRAGKNPQMLTEELSLLRQLDELGLPTVNARGPISVDGQPALLFDRFEQGSKDIVRLQDGRVRTVGSSDLLNERSIGDLQDIRQTMVDKSVKVDDLQFLIGRDGRVVIADPLAVQVGQTPSKTNLRMIDLLIEAAKRNGH